MKFDLVRRAEPIKTVLDREREFLVEELISDAFKEHEIAEAIASHKDLSEGQLRSDAMAAREEILQAAVSEENSLRDSIRIIHGRAYNQAYWYGPLWVPSYIVSFTAWGLAAALGPGAASWLLVRRSTDSAWWASIVAAVVVLLYVMAAIFAKYIADEFRNKIGRLVGSVLLSCIFLISAVAAFYAGYRIAGAGWIAAVNLIAAVGLFALGLVFFDLEWWPYAEDRAGVKRYSPDYSRVSDYEAWRGTLREAGVLTYLRRQINNVLLKNYSTILSVREAPGLRHLGDLKYHVATESRDELIRRTNAVDGGSFALAGPRGAGKTILMRAFCQRRYASDPTRDLGIVVSAPVEYEARDFVLYLYAQVCRETKAYIRRATSTTDAQSRRESNTLPRLRALLPFRPIISSGPSNTLTALARQAEEKLNQARYLQSFSTELSGKLSVKVTELSTKVATSLVEQPLTYPEIVSDLRGFLETTANTLRATAISEEGESSPRVLIGIDELDRMGSGERVRKFLDDIKAIFWVPGCYFLVSVSEDALRAFELAGHGMRDTFDSAFDEVIRVQHLDFRASTNLLRARVTGLSIPYHALAYCLSGGLPRELMRAARAIAELYVPGIEVKLGQVTATLVADELARHCHAALLALADTAGSDAAANVVRRLDEGRHPTKRDLRKFAHAVTMAATDCSEAVRSLAESVAAHAHYLATLTDIFADQLMQQDLERATDSTEPLEARFETLASARRYLGVNDAFARMLVDTLMKTWRVTRVNSKQQPLPESVDRPR